jgi:16S rRNA (uracil1498-N3)-methyltransferase
MPSDPPRHRVFVTAPLATGAEVAASAAQAHYLGTVLRLRPDNEIALFNGRDGEWRARIQSIGRKSATLMAVEQLRPQAAEPDLWLCFAPIKHARIDTIAEKAGELGAAVLQPVITSRTNVSRVNVERLTANAVEAAEQCERLTVPEVRVPVPLRQLVETWPTERKLLFCDEAGNGRAIADALATAPRGGAWAILVGPEGGFDAVERSMLSALPAVLPVSLGPRLLRADTAAIAAMSLWQALVGDWRPR